MIVTFVVIFNAQAEKSIHKCVLTFSDGVMFLEPGGLVLLPCLPHVGSEMPPCSISESQMFDSYEAPINNLADPFYEEGQKHIRNHNT